MRLLHNAFGSINGLDLSEMEPAERITLFVRRAARELGFARAITTPEHQRVPVWPADDDITAADALVPALYLYATGTPLGDPGGNDTPQQLSEHSRVTRHVLLGLRAGWEEGCRALAHGIPEGVEQRMAYRRLESDTDT